jgi:hypothetical protein
MVCGGEMLKVSQCGFCKHLHRKPREQMIRWTCAAFPGGIPDALQFNRRAHDRPYPGDNGILFEHDGGEFGREIERVVKEREEWRARGGKEWWEDLEKEKVSVPKPVGFEKRANPE